MKLTLVKSKLERIAKKFYIRVITIAVSVGISAWYVNHEKKRYFEEAVELRKSDREKNDRIHKLENEVSQLRSNMIILSIADDNYPNPKWMKSNDLMMLKLNKSYEDIYLKPFGKSRSDYIGKYDYDIWPEDVAFRFRENDRKVLMSKKPITFSEKVPTADGKEIEVEITKYPIIINGEIIGIGGFSVIKHLYNE